MHSVYRTLRSTLRNTTARLVGRRNFVYFATAEFYVFWAVTLAGLASRHFEVTLCLFLKDWGIQQQHNVTSHTNWMSLLLLFIYLCYIFHDSAGLSGETLAISGWIQQIDEVRTVWLVDAVYWNRFILFLIWISTYTGRKVILNVRLVD
jgi:hypothetical protein